MPYHEYQGKNGRIKRYNGPRLGHFDDSRRIISNTVVYTDDELAKKYDGAKRFFAYNGYTIDELTGVSEVVLLAANEFSAVANWARMTATEIHVVGLNCGKERAKEISVRYMEQYGVKTC